MMKLDLKDAYYTIPAHHKHRYRRYLQFIFQDKLYEFRCLPFGLSSAPRGFTKMLKPVAALLRSQGVRVVFYLDDILLLHQSKDEQWKLFHQVLDLLQSLGFTVKREKCSAYPTQQLIFLGGSGEASPTIFSCYANFSVFTGYKRNQFVKKLIMIMI